MLGIGPGLDGTGPGTGPGPVPTQPWRPSGRNPFPKAVLLAVVVYELSMHRGLAAMCRTIAIVRSTLRESERFRLATLQKNSSARAVARSLPLCAALLTGLRASWGATFPFMACGSEHAMRHHVPIAKSAISVTMAFAAKLPPLQQEFLSQLGLSAVGRRS